MNNIDFPRPTTPSVWDEYWNRAMKEEEKHFGWLIRNYLSRSFYRAELRTKYTRIKEHSCLNFELFPPC
jgi:hypothetical protein